MVVSAVYILAVLLLVVDADTQVNHMKLPTEEPVVESGASHVDAQWVSTSTEERDSDKPLYFTPEDVLTDKISESNAQPVAESVLDSEGQHSESAEIEDPSNQPFGHEGSENKINDQVPVETDKQDGQIDGDEDEEGNSPSLSVIGAQRRPVKRIGQDSETSNPGGRRILPFLYPSILSTLKTVFSFLISELVEENGIQDDSLNNSDWSNQSSLIHGMDLSKGINSSSNHTDTMRKTRFQCTIKNVTMGDIGKVRIVNSTELLEMLNLSKSQKLSACVLVLFYAPWCHFCAKTAPHYNALARAFPQLDILAVDTSHFSYLNARFGTVAVPNVMLFHSRSAVRFNHTQRSLDKFTQFVKNNTGLEPRRFIYLEPLDFVGPLSCVVKQGRDGLLWLSWLFVAVCSAYGFVFSRYGQSFIARVKVLWQEHQHID